MNLILLEVFCCCLTFAQIISPTANTKIYFNRNGELLDVDGTLKSVRIQWQVTTKATDKVLIGIGQYLGITVVDLAYLSPSDTAQQILNTGFVVCLFEKKFSLCLNLNLNKQ